jgi:hypothetical protein
LRSLCTYRSASGRDVAWFGVLTATTLLGVTFGMLGMEHSEAQAVTLPLLPTSVAYDAAGNLYFADTNRHEVYESSLAGVLTVVAGNGIQGFSGDGGTATNAELDSPQGVAIGSDGTLYIADTGSERIRAVSAGQITTFAGNGSVGFAGDDGAAVNASFRWPNALAIDASGALLVCDSGNERVRRISGGVIETVAGNGTQGFAGDGTAAVLAELDMPMGLAVSSSGQIFVADSHNDRIRVIATDGSISTFAGNGVQGYAGDGGAATTAELSLPSGLIVTSSGAVIFADSNNQRIRMVDANGTISTIAGSGVQGAVSDGTSAMTAGMNTPRGVAVSSFGSPVYADMLNHLVRESVVNGNLYVPAGLASTRTSVVALSVNPSVGYGQTDAAVNVMGSAGTPQGVVELLDGTSVVMQTTLAAGAATFAPNTLSTGPHSLSVAFLGDGVNPAAVSSTFNVSVTPAVVTATASAANAEYGQVIPALTGSLSGVLPQDTGKVAAVFTTTAVALSSPGSYAIGATLTGPESMNYSVVMSAASGSLQIVPAASTIVEQPLAQHSYAGLPLLLTADVSSTTEGIPTGTVQFIEGSTVVGTGTLLSGVATGTYLSPPSGMHSIVANYGGDADFNASSSQTVTTSVSSMPDFTLTSAGSTTQTVAAGDVASYTMTVGAQSGAFTGVVDLSVNGLPAGATVAFSPPQVVPGAASVAVAMNVQTSATLSSITMVRRYRTVVLVCLFFPWLLIGKYRRGLCRSIAMCSVLVLLTCAVGCGARSITVGALGGQSFTLTVTGTSTNLAGAVVSHSMNVMLVVE